jgi:hypothetical protein
MLPCVVHVHPIAEFKLEIRARCEVIQQRATNRNPNHGTWFGRQELTPAPDGARVELKAGGFATEDDLKDWFDEAGLLLKIPEKGPRGHEARMQILDLIKRSKQAGEDLPDYDDLRTGTGRVPR